MNPLLEWSNDLKVARAYNPPAGTYLASPSALCRLHGSEWVERSTVLTAIARFRNIHPARFGASRAFWSTRTDNLSGIRPVRVAR